MGGVEEHVGRSHFAEQKNTRGREEGESFAKIVRLKLDRFRAALLRECVPILSCKLSKVGTLRLLTLRKFMAAFRFSSKW